MESVQEKPALTLQDWWLRVQRYRWWIISSLFVGWVLVTAAGWFLPAKYRSDTVIIIEQQRVPEHYVEPNVAIDLQQRLQSMSEQILSRTRLQAIIEKFHLYDSDRKRLDSDALVEQMRKDIGIELIKAEGNKDQLSAFKISYSAGSAAVAQRVTSELTSLFIGENLKNRQQLSEDTTAFLENQLDDARKNLDAQEERLREFKSRYLGQLPEQMQSNVTILSGLQARLQTATDALNQSQQQRLYLQSMLDQYRAVRASIPTDSKSLPAPVNLDQRLQTLRAELDDLNSKYTPAHPDVVRVKNEIAETEKLKEQLAEQAKEQKKAGKNAQQDLPLTTSDGQTVSPVASIESQLKANQLEIDNRKADINRVQKEIDAYQERLNLTPAREQELAAITRDHEQSRAYYESLLAKKNNSEMATNLEKRQEGEQFRMIDPPSLPQKPYFPNRLFFSLGGLGFGLVVGLAIMIVFELANPLLYREDELRGLTVAPVLITLPPILTLAEERSRSRRHLLETVAAILILICIPAGTLIVYLKG